jgi:CMP-N,N'-diacetyllegionaminic acid synthase
VSVVALVPARGGSKGLPGKNVADLGGVPLMAYSVCAGLAATLVDRVLVTTDARELAELATGYGAEAPFLRPAELATDDANDLGYVRHALDWLAAEEGLRPELVLQLRPTTPLRDPGVVDDAIRALRGRDEATGLRSVHELAEPPQKMLGISDGWLTGLFPADDRPEYFNLPRQAFPSAYWPNGYVDVIRPETIEREGTLYGSRVLAFVTPRTIEIDGAEDLDHARWELDRRGSALRDAIAGGADGR